MTLKHPPNGVHHPVYHPVYHGVHHGGVPMEMVDTLHGDPDHHVPVYHLCDMDGGHLSGHSKALKLRRFLPCPLSFLLFLKKKEKETKKALCQRNTRARRRWTGSLPTRGAKS